MTTSPKKEPFAFSETILALDGEFERFEHLSEEIKRLSIESDSGLERAKLLLSRFSECGQRIGEGIQALVKSLETARARAEASAQFVSQRAQVIQERQNRVHHMHERFQGLAERVGKLSEEAGHLQIRTKGLASEEDKATVIQHLPQLDLQLKGVIKEAYQLKADAGAANMKALEKNADSLGQSLESVRRKLGASMERPSDRAPEKLM